jgi:hypothetical protein
MYIIAVVRVSGFRFIGPFQDELRASNYGHQFLSGVNWEIAKLVPPAE